MIGSPAARSCTTSRSTRCVRGVAGELDAAALTPSASTRENSALTSSSNVAAANSEQLFYAFDTDQSGGIDDAESDVGDVSDAALDTP